MESMNRGPFTKETVVVCSLKGSQSLVRDAGTEKLMQRFKRIEREQKELLQQGRKREFGKALFSLAQKFFGMGEKEIRELDEGEFNALQNAIARRVKRRLRFFWFINGFFCSVLAALSFSVGPFFLPFYALLLVNMPICHDNLSYHFSFHPIRKCIGKFTLEMTQQTK